MRSHSRPGFAIILALTASSIIGCGKGYGPLVMKPDSKTKGPWCAANERVKIGDRVVGYVHEGAKHRTFFVDDAGKEYDPEILADQAWTYLERTGDAKDIRAAFDRDGYYPGMVIASIKPMVVILEPTWNKQLRSQIGTNAQRYHWLALISSERQVRTFQKGMQWFSPDLKQRPTDLTFSPDGVAEIALKSGRIILTREGELYTSRRE